MRLGELVRNSESSEFAGKVAVVTGGSRGIGKAIVLEAVARGARVAFCARTIGDHARQVLEEAERLSGPGNVIAVQADVSHEDDVAAFFDRTLEVFGKVDVVINNAGFYNVEGGASASGLLLQIPRWELDTILSTNLTGAFLVSRRAIKEFLAQGTHGSIISIGSVAQDGGTGLSCYAISKAGLLGLTDSIAREYGDKGIRAHVMAVGFLKTDLNKDTPEKYLQQLIDWGPQKRAGLVEEIASVALFLASPRSALFNASQIFVSGGAKEVPAYLVKINQ
jgi:3-oxoacyl-[acyl-carrier protein] reductase